MHLKLVKFVFLFIFVSLYFYFSEEIYVKSEDKRMVYSLNSNNEKISNNEIDVFINDSYDEHFATISIPKINIYKKLYNLNSKENTVDKNIQVLKDSSMPNVSGGNFILAAHSGYSSIAYFHNLHKLDIGDNVLINYNGAEYNYIITKMYDVKKTGKVLIDRDKNKTSITLITCKGDDKQLVVIGYLK